MNVVRFLWRREHPVRSILVLAVGLLMLVAVGLGLWCIPLQRPPADKLASPDVLLENFERVVLEREFGMPKELDRVQKWDGPVRIALTGEQTPLYWDYLSEQASILSSLTYLTIDVLEVPDGSENVMIHLVSEENYPEMALPHIIDDGLRKIVSREPGCVAKHYHRHGTIVSDRIVIPLTHGEARTRHCLLEELTQGLGLPNDSELIQPSIFSHAGPPLQELSINDRVLIRTLYDYRIPPGMPRGLAIEFARTIIAELVRAVERSGPETLYQR